MQVDVQLQLVVAAVDDDVGGVAPLQLRVGRPRVQRPHRHVEHSRTADRLERGTSRRRRTTCRTAAPFRVAHDREAAARRGDGGVAGLAVDRLREVRDVARERGADHVMRIGTSASQPLAANSRQTRPRNEPPRERAYAAATSASTSARTCAARGSSVNPSEPWRRMIGSASGRATARARRARASAGVSAPRSTPAAWTPGAIVPLNERSYADEPRAGDEHDDDASLRRSASPGSSRTHDPRRTAVATVAGASAGGGAMAVAPR